ncbi:conserved hypothetical protein [Tenacibaculum litopenaei]|uniref:hypothetical protein n=1 Tax=Tenacibaculum litopenaei TaxID=396016 RepID=UPI0038944D2B
MYSPQPITTMSYFLKKVIPLTILFLMIAGACKKAPAKTTEKEEEKYSVICKEAIINGAVFKVYSRRPGNFTIVNEAQKIIYQRDENPADFKIADVNGDGFPDILLEYFTNVPGVNELLVYDLKTASFKEVTDFANFPAATRIENSDFYYSYHKSGCADSNWDSDLFKIIDYKAIRFGNIRGIGCGVGEANGIYINKVDNEKLKQIKFIPREAGYWDGKWDFIAEYWSKNYTKFQ